MMKNKEELLLFDYKMCHDGYIGRDSLVPKEFAQMLQAFVLLITLSSASRVLHAFNQRIEFTVLILMIIVGTLTLIAYEINIEAKASAKKALRKRMVEIEQQFDADEFQYWKSVVEREMFIMEKICKTVGPQDRFEKGSASHYFVWASRVILIVWFVLVSLLLFWDQAINLSQRNQCPPFAAVDAQPRCAQLCVLSSDVWLKGEIHGKDLQSFYKPFMGIWRCL